ncbi:hypothetical protein RN001_005710 [Aquatica leii]|uniref:DDE Tnp4 domain-containing protein n=1 Tax=Aquatica leii TaxID=1421715 RepID=A0AAN7SAR4_9COLE|nr:hypothetical protein RN001_005710 [Aquatica leii]
MPTLKHKIKGNSPIKISNIKRFSDDDKLCLTFIRLKRGYTLKELSIFCNPSISHISRLTAGKEILTKKIARIHVEIATHRIKNYRILAKPIQITMLPLLSNIFSIICFLVNFEKPLVL